MALKFEELRVLQAAEEVADGLWRRVVRWEAFARDTVGKQITRFAADLKTQRQSGKSQQKAVREASAEYAINRTVPLFSTEDLDSLATGANTQYPISSSSSSRRYHRRE